MVPSPSRAAQGRTALVITLTIQVMVAWAAIAGAVLAPLAANDLGVAPYLIGIYVSVTYAFAATSGLVSGGFIARFGPLRMSEVGLGLCAAGMALATVGTPAAALAAAAIVGVGYGPITPASSHILARTTAPERMNLVFSIKQTGVPLGNALAGAVLPSLAAWLGWRGAALATALLCLAVAATAEPLRTAFDVELDRQRRYLSLNHMVRPLALIFRSPQMRMLSVTSFAYAGMQTSLGTFLVTLLSDRLDMPIVLAGLVLSVAQGAGVAGRIGWGFVADRLVPPMWLLGMLGLTMSACAVLVGLFTKAWSLTAIVAVCAAYGATAIAWNGVHLAQVARHAPAGRAGEITGGTTFVTFMGVVAVPTLFSAILSVIGSYALGYSSVAVLTFASGVWYMVRLRQA
jgi:MFS family permease